MIKDLCFEVIQKCPNNCLFCSSLSNINKENVIDFASFKKTIDFFLDNGGIEEISLSGGEPMLNQDIYKMISYCANKGIKVTLYTSGIVLKDSEEHSSNPYIERILKQYNEMATRDISINEFNELKKAGLNKIVFDIQAINEDEYNVLMGTKANLANLLKSMLHASYFDMEKSIHFIPNKLNISQFKDVLEMANLANFNELRLLRLVIQGRGKENKDKLLLSDEELESFLSGVKELKSAKTKIKVGIPLTQDEHVCTAGFDKLVIRYDGQVLPCPAFKDIDLKLLEKKGLKSINIFVNLEDYVVREGSYSESLCKQFKRH